MKNEDWKIPLYKIYTDDEDVNLITKIIKRGSQWALGPEIEEFENELKKIYWCRLLFSIKFWNFCFACSIIITRYRKWR